MMIIEQLAQNLESMKKEFFDLYDGNSNIQEIIPVSESNKFPIDKKFLKLLHLFAIKNPIYYNSYNQNVSNLNNTVYEGDINQYWLNSITHTSSHAPFLPTWIFSACIMALQAKELGFSEIVDVGSGDGRIAYCAKILGLTPHSIEIDEKLVDLQKSIIQETGINFNPHCANVTEFDFNSLKLEKPIFFIGGLAQMGGITLASSIIENITDLKSKNKNIGFAFAGTNSKKYANSEHEAGWGELIEKNNIKIIKTLYLPTVWTWKETENTPYIFAKLA